jgi:nitrogen regulatory protein PII
MYMAFFVLDDPDKLPKVLEALEQGGISGATIVESTGLHRQQKKHVGLRYVYSSPLLDEMDNISVFTIVPDLLAVETCLKCVESVVGDMNNPDTGIFTAWELGIVKGLTQSGNEAR